MESSSDQYAPAAAFYDFVPFYRERADVPFYVEEAARAGGPVLELGSGSGRVLIALAKAGIEVTGVDASTAMLRVCKDALQREEGLVRSRVTLICADIRLFAVRPRFALVTIPFRTFEHLLASEEQIDCLTCVRDHLLYGGRLVFDVCNPSVEFLAEPATGVEIEADQPFSLPDGRRVQRRGRVIRHHRHSQVTDYEMIYYVSDVSGIVERTVHALSLRHSFKFEVEHLLCRTGFKVEHVYSDFARAPFGTVYPGALIFVARKD